MLKTIAIAICCFCCAASAAPTTQAVARSQAVMADVDHFKLELKYHGNEDKPHYHLTLSVQPVDEKVDTFKPKVKISIDDARVIFDHLAASSFLDNAIGVSEAEGKIPEPTGPVYTLTLRTTHLIFTEDLGWNEEMFERLQKLQKVLSGDAKQAMDLLVERLGGYHDHWETPNRGDVDSGKVLKIAKAHVDEHLKWPLGGIYTVRFLNGEWSVLVWRVNGYFDFGKPQFVPGGHRVLRIDKEGKIVRDIPGR